MLQSEMRQDVMPCALCASFPADDSVEAAEVPSPPPQDVLPKALPIALSLIVLHAYIDCEAEFKYEMKDGFYPSRGSETASGDVYINYGYGSTTIRG
ncbi:MAG: hypothetical protein CL933_16830 [Deltaproteobacteria bacterium]|nr:hypothetical protein [Deltaproteobacteria bacterium]